MACTKHQVGTTFWKLRWRKSCTPLWHEAHFQVKMYKTPGPDHFLEVEMAKKVHAVVARSTFQSQNAQNTPGPDHFWKLRCRKSARRCGAKMREAHLQVKKLKAQHVPSTFGSCDVEKVHAVVTRSTKHTILGAVLEVAMSKKCTPLWREAHFEVKMSKTPGVRTTFGCSDVVSPATFWKCHKTLTTCSLLTRCM